MAVGRRLGRQRGGASRYSFYGEIINAYARKNLSGYSYNADYSRRDPVTQLPLLLTVGVEVKF
jgi:hypothetical protein